MVKRRWIKSVRVAFYYLFQNPFSLIVYYPLYSLAECCFPPHLHSGLGLLIQKESTAAEAIYVFLVYLASLLWIFAVSSALSRCRFFCDWSVIQNHAPATNWFFLNITLLLLRYSAYRSGLVIVFALSFSTRTSHRKELKYECSLFKDWFLLNEVCRK